MALVRDLNPESYTFDVSAKVTAKGLSKTISKKNVPLSQFTEGNGK